MPGIYDLPNGKRRAVAWIGNGGKGHRLEKLFPKGTSDRKITRWQEQARQELRERPMPKAGTLSADVDAYVTSRPTMPTLATRERHLRLWIYALGPTRPRDTVTPLEIRGVLERWELGGWTKATCNRARTALMSLYSELNGRTGYNPVRDVKRHREPQKPPKRLSYPLVESIIANIPPWTGFGRRPDPKLREQTIARLRVIAYLGLPHALVKQLEPAHLDPDDETVLVAGRGKGAGTPAVYLPVGKVGVAVLRAFFACGAQGPFRNETLRDVFRSGAMAAGRPDLTPYDLRHLYGTTMLALTKNRAATRDLMLHTDDTMTAVYAKAAIPIELRAALAAFDAETVGSGCGQGVVLAPPSDPNSKPVIH